MDRRSNTRYPAEQAVWVTDLLQPGRSAAGTIRDISNSGVCVMTTLPLIVASIVRLDANDNVLFGFVTYATAEDAGLRIGIDVQHVLLGDSDMSRLLQQVLQEMMPAVTLGSLY